MREGLDYSQQKGRNTALLAKLNWHFHTEKDVKWALVLRKKYCNFRRVNAINVDRLPCIATWKAMKKRMDSFAKGSVWTIGRESTLSFWHGNWTPKGPLCDLIHGLLSREEERLKVKDVVADLGWDGISFILISLQR